MQTKANETPRIIGLIVAIVVVLGIAIFRVVQATRPAAEQTAQGTAANSALPRASTTGTVLGGVNPIVPANESDTRATGLMPAGQGMTRQLTKWDEKPTLGDAAPLIVQNTAAFRTIEGRKPVAVKPSIRPNLGGTPLASSGGGINLPPWTSMSPGAGNPPQAGSFLTSRPSSPPAPPEPELTLNGVVTGQNGFAVFTVRDSGAKEGQVVYRQVGEKVGTYRVTSITAEGVRLSGRSDRTVLVEQTIGGRSEAADETSPVAAPSVTSDRLGIRP